MDQLKQRPNIHPSNNSDLPFTDQELEDAICRVKNNKAPGPDHNANELFRLLNEDSRRILLAYYNGVWEAGEAPDEWKEALVVSIYKGKGVDTDPANYRPISLLNTVYKVFAAMLQARLATIHDSNLRSTQYGFRAERSTAHPLFILRRAMCYSCSSPRVFMQSRMTRPGALGKGHRAMEWSNQTSTPLYLVLLDWKQAFDSIDHNAMLEGLRRFGLSRSSLKLIHTLYTDATFYTEGPLGEVATGRVRAGIRQGCPLSPYLFIIVLSVLLTDVDEDLRHNTWSVNRLTFDLEYADDTLLISLTTTQLQSFLNALEKQAEFYGMSLNQTKNKYPYPEGNDEPVD